MTLKIEINMDNAAFEPDSGTEAARILRKLAADIDGYNYPVDKALRRLLDVNGNAVGTAEITTA